MVLSYQHQVTLTRLLQDYLVDLCREYLPYTANLEIDGVVCLSNSKDLSSQIVLKIHRTLADIEKDHGSKAPPSTQSGWPWPLKQQGSLYGADAPQDLSLKEPASSKTALTPLDALASSVEKSPFSGYSSKPNSKPAALQPINKGAVASLLYQKIMEGGKQLSPQNLSPELDITKPALPSNKQKEKDDTEENLIDDDPSLHQGEMLCKICSETVFGGFFALQNHTYEVHRRFVCKKCYSTFSLRCNLRRHERLHEGLKPYSCDSCDKTFSRSTDLRMHMQKHLTGSDATPTNNNNNTKSPVAVACDKCNKTFANVQNLRWHLYKQHKVNGEQMWVCTICEQLFHDADSYHQHRESHTAALNKRARMEEEHVEHSNDDEVMRDEYQKDLLAIDDEANSNITCLDESSNEEPRQEAFAAIKQALAMGAPEQNGHRNNKRKRKGNPIKHVAEVCVSDEEVIYDLSGKTMLVETVNPSSAASPVPSVESENDPLQRSYNSDVLANSTLNRLSFSSVDEVPKDHLHSLSLLTHYRSPLVIKPDYDMSPMSLPRSSEVLYSPSQFDDSLLTPDRVKQESLTPVDDGDDERDYTCSYDGCTEPCHGFRAYEVHCVSVHSRYPCKLCKQTFSGKNNRTRHMRNHNRAKIYPCPDCGKYFSRPDSMREHRFIHTASYQEDKCRRCGQEFQRKSLLLAHLKNCFRSSRSKNGSIDESPYMDDSIKAEHLLPSDSNGSDSQLAAALVTPEDRKDISQIAASITAAILTPEENRSVSEPSASSSENTANAKSVTSIISPNDKKSTNSNPSTPVSTKEGENSIASTINMMTPLNIPRVVNENNNNPSPVPTMLKVPLLVPSPSALNFKASKQQREPQDDMDTEESNLVIDTSQFATVQSKH